MAQTLEIGEAALFETLRTGLEVTDYLDEAVGVRSVAQEFVGQSVLIEPVTAGNDPISAYVYATPYPAFGEQGYRLQKGLFLRPHPSRARGAIESVELADASLRIRPWRGSLYRADRGYFQVNMLDEQGEPLVKVSFLEK